MFFALSSSLFIFIIILETVSVSASYDESIAYTSVSLCGAAYCCIQGCQEWDCNICTQRFPHMKGNITEVHTYRHDAHGFVGYDPSTRIIYLSLTGTDPFSILDWLDDIDAIKIPYTLCEGCEVHKGSLDTYHQLRNKVLDAVKVYRSQDPEAMLMITGHSLGGGLAVHAALDIIHTLKIPPESIRSLYTFGQLRLGNDAFQTFVTSTLPNTHYRITHHKDPVPHLPPEAFGFRHEVQEVFYKGDPSKYITCNETNGEDPECTNQYLLDFNILDHLTYLNFPFIANYIQCAIFLTPPPPSSLPASSSAPLLLSEGLIQTS